VFVLGGNGAVAQDVLALGHVGVHELRIAPVQHLDPRGHRRLGHADLLGRDTTGGADDTPIDRRSPAMLTLAEANQMVQGALARAKELNNKISVAVCDAGGRLVAFNRMDGALWAGAYGSQGKAIASAAFARASGELQERAGSPIIQGIAAAEG